MGNLVKSERLSESVGIAWGCNSDEDKVSLPGSQRGWCFGSAGVLEVDWGVWDPTNPPLGLGEWRRGWKEVNLMFNVMER